MVCSANGRDKLHDIADPAGRFQQLRNLGVGRLHVGHGRLGLLGRMLHLAGDLVDGRGHLVGCCRHCLDIAGRLFGGSGNNAGLLLGGVRGPR